ncbi:MAG TPA: ABC transporter substrate-binding protein [Thermodesulfobacteriota bacterium]
MLRLLALALTALLLHVGAPSGHAGDPTPRIGGTYRFPLRYSPRTLDPARSTDYYAVTVIQQIFDGLVDFDRDLNIIPAIARSWRVSRDGRVYTFDLRRDVRFHSGRAVTADDVVYSLTRLFKPETRSTAGETFDLIVGARDVRQGRTETLRGVRAVTPNRVEVTLEEPYAPFLSLLATNKAKIVPREAVESKDVPFERAPVGTGPFRIVRWDEGKAIVLEANPAHFRGRPYLDRIRYAIMPTATDADIYRAFRKGDFDESPIPSELRDEALASGTFPVVRRPTLALQFYGFNLSRPEWRDPRVRMALLLAFDRAAVVEAGTKGKHRPAAGILPPGVLGYNPARDVPRVDRARAAALLGEAGGPEAVRGFEMWSAVRSEAQRAEFDGIADAAHALGLAAEPRFADDWPQFQRFLTEGRMSLFRYAWFADLPDPDNILGILFHSQSRYNYWHYSNPQVDALLDEGRRELNPVRRAEIYRRVEAQVLEDVPIIPILHIWYEQAYQPSVRGVEVSALGAPYVPMRKVWLDRP